LIDSPFQLIDTVIHDPGKRIPVGEAAENAPQFGGDLATNLVPGWKLLERIEMRCQKVDSVEILVEKRNRTIVQLLVTGNDLIHFREQNRELSGKLVEADSHPFFNVMPRKPIQFLPDLVEVCEFFHAFEDIDPVFRINSERGAEKVARGGGQVVEFAVGL